MTNRNTRLVMHPSLLKESKLIIYIGGNGSGNDLGGNVIYGVGEPLISLCLFCEFIVGIDLVSDIYQ